MLQLMKQYKHKSTHHNLILKLQAIMKPLMAIFQFNIGAGFIFIIENALIYLSFEICEITSEKKPTLKYP